MPRPRKPARLIKKRERSGAVYWVIRDGEEWHRTGCVESDVEGADRALTEYKARKYQPSGVNNPSSVPIADALLLYARNKGPEKKRPNEFRAMMERLDAYWGGKMIAEIRGATCRDYTQKRGAKIAARNELSMLRAAVNHYHAEHTLDAVPKVTLPPPNPPRMRWLRREEAARLLWAAWRAHQKYKGEATRRATARHLARLILVGLYTGTRPGAILDLYWMPNTIGGHADLERGVLHRMANGEQKTKKRKSPVRIPRRLLAHLRRWRRMDDSLPPRLAKEGSHLPRPIVHWRGEPVIKINKAFRSVVASAGLDKEVTPHVLRHTRATWLMQAGIDKYEAAGSLGMTVEMLETVYGHHHPDFQKDAADAY